MNTPRTMSNKLSRKLAVLVGATALLPWVCPSASLAQSPRDADVRAAQGKVERFTTAPQGEVDGAVLDNGTWLHWPPHMQDRFTAVVKQGDPVRANGRTETGPAGDTHFEIQSVTDLRTNATTENPDFANDPPAPPRGPGNRDRRAAVPPPPIALDRSPAGPARADGETRTIEGRIQRYTTAPGGETDGAVLDDGTWLHWPPHMQDRFKDVTREADRVRATGRTETGPAGDTHFEVQVVTNLRTNARVDNPDFADAPPAPTRTSPVRPAPPAPGADRFAPGADRDQRLRDLQAQVDQLRQEIERLQRER